jgi:flagellar assembly factor FliW
MLAAYTKYFGPVSYSESAVLEFADGIPGFEHERSFVALSQPSQEPLVFLQSLQCSDLCFLSVPVQVALPDYRLELSGDDRNALGLTADEGPASTGEVLSLAFLAMDEEVLATANLMAPVVINVNNGRARQVVQTAGRYSHRHVLDRAPQCVPALPA